MDLGEKGARKRLRGWEGENWDCDVIFERRIIYLKLKNAIIVLPMG